MAKVRFGNIEETRDVETFVESTQVASVRFIPRYDDRKDTKESKNNGHYVEAQLISPYGSVLYTTKNPAEIAEIRKTFCK